MGNTNFKWMIFLTKLLLKSIRLLQLKSETAQLQDGPRQAPLAH
jgi:hypothetical protein